jgi:hypothetical protein
MALELEVFHVLYNRKKFHKLIYKKFNSEYSDRALESEVFHVLYNRKKFHTSIKKKLILKIQHFSSVPILHYLQEVPGTFY